METEVPRLLARRRAADGVDFTFHSSRSRLHSVTPEELARMVDDGERCAAEVADADVDVIAYACLVALMAQGEGYHRVAEERISRAAAENGVEVPVVTSAGALLDGVRALGAGRIAVLAPYMKPLTQLVVDYIEADGIEVVDSHCLEVPDNLEVGRIDPTSLLGHLDSLDLTDADALVLSACVQCPSLPAIEAAQEKTGLPVLSAATATTFRILESLGLDSAIEGGGALLDGTRSSVGAGS
ncbi:MAG: Asp/Glu racemase [Actinobacteria bacterium]|nr:Asp/Glu racemase [Actinomycetota bacterium]